MNYTIVGVEQHVITHLQQTGEPHPQRPKTTHMIDPNKDENVTNTDVN